MHKDDERYQDRHATSAANFTMYLGEGRDQEMK